jgi:hypothetical protein
VLVLGVCVYFEHLLRVATAGFGGGAGVVKANSTNIEGTK